jgi:DNA-binding transcriptional ArsR family regulator
MSTGTTPRSRSGTAPIVRQATVRDLSSRVATEPVTVEFDVRTAFEFLVSLVIEEEPELLPEDAAWLTAARDGLSDALRRDVRRAFGDAESGGAGVSLALMPLIVADRTVRTAADVVALAGRLVVEDLVAGATCEMGDHAHEQGDRDRVRVLASMALAGDTDARGELVGSWPEKARPTLLRLLEDPDGELRSLRRVLRAWAERFAAIEPRVARMLERDEAARRAEAAGLTVAEIVERVTGGVRFSPEAGIARVILAPSYFARPYNYLFGEQDWRMYCYPLADDALDGDPSALPSATVRLFKALGDETRLRILRLLRNGDLYLTEIAERMALSKPTVRHHMLLLRAAGLVTVTETAGLTYYSLRRDRVADATPDLQRLLGA